MSKAKTSPSATPKTAPKTGHGGARPGSGRRSIVGGTAARRIPLPLLAEIDTVLDVFQTKCAALRAGQKDAAKLPPAPFPKVTLSPPLDVPLYLSKVPAGFPSPATDYVEQRVDLSKKLIQNPAATIMVTVTGDSMIGKGVFDGDTLIVDRSRPPRSGDMVVAAVNGDFTVKTFYKRGKVCELRPENPAPEYRALPFPQGEEDYIVGVVTFAIKQCSR